jgi:hypothetical protein
MLMSKISRTYLKGVEDFLNFAYEHCTTSDIKIPCPCNKCFNGRHLNRETVRDHLIINGIFVSYTNWFAHGEPRCASNNNAQTSIGHAEI